MKLLADSLPYNKEMELALLGCIFVLFSAWTIEVVLLLSRKFVAFVRENWLPPSRTPSLIWDWTVGFASLKSVGITAGLVAVVARTVQVKGWAPSLVSGASDANIHWPRVYEALAVTVATFLGLFLIAAGSLLMWVADRSPQAGALQGGEVKEETIRSEIDKIRTSMDLVEDILYQAKYTAWARLPTQWRRWRLQEDLDYWELLAILRRRKPSKRVSHAEVVRHMYRSVPVVLADAFRGDMLIWLLFACSMLLLIGCLVAPNPAWGIVMFFFQSIAACVFSYAIRRNLRSVKHKVTDALFDEEVGGERASLLGGDGDDHDDDVDHGDSRKPSSSSGKDKYGAKSSKDDAGKEGKDARSGEFVVAATSEVRERTGDAILARYRIHFWFKSPKFASSVLRMLLLLQAVLAGLLYTVLHRDWSKRGVPAGWIVAVDVIAGMLLLGSTVSTLVALTHNMILFASALPPDFYFKY